MSQADNGRLLESGNFSRRGILKAGGLAGLAAAIGAGGTLHAQDAAPAPKLKGNLKHSVSRWCYKTTTRKLAEKCKEIGISAIELMKPDEWEPLKEFGLVCSMTSTHALSRGLNRKENHDECLKKIRDAIEATAAAGFPNVITFPGNRDGMDDDTGLKNCAEALKQVVGMAEEKGVTICMELLNSKRDHKDYQCDHTAWGVNLCKAVGSPRFKLLYDIYHMQIMEGDVIATLRENIEYIGHIHTGGVPGRHEIDETQELYYPAIMKALVDLKFTGYVGQEFTPTRDQFKSLEQAIRICDV
ncbi:MAG TPA: TIM barrel protein [Candidatus Brocadiia bacterium]|nr:TIM barrel protein [Candidatus Brocadiia bacterium]